ncbi:mitochondrial carrier [Mrakia frigida]|uniref:mitochondrial carrier n=1 Tax=Mrakia frigida TaxID=29902 RepID=UPI003FCBF12F
MAAVLSDVKIGNERKKGPYPFWLGGVAATCGALVTHPLDLTKVRLQASGDKSMVQSIKKTIATRGIFGLWDGWSGTVFRQMTYSLCRFAAYDAAKVLIHPEKTPLQGWEMALAGTMAGAVAGVVGNPGEILMVRMQGDYAKTPEKRLNYKHSIDGLIRMTREEGFSSWTRGMAPNVVRSMLMNMSQLGSYDLVKSELLKTSYFEDDVKTHVTASIAAGTIATTVCSPADVIKSRVMNASGAGSSSVSALISKSLREEGYLFMFKGWVPAWTRLQPTTILIFLSLEQLKNGWDTYVNN